MATLTVEQARDILHAAALECPYCHGQHWLRVSKNKRVRLARGEEARVPKREWARCWTCKNWRRLATALGAPLSDERPPTAKMLPDPSYRRVGGRGAQWRP